jgi:hypothetical protein
MVTRPMTATPPCRNPNVADLMILVAATAAGLTGYLQVRDWRTAASFLLTAWSLALIAIRLRGPRPRLRRVFRQPGMVACCVAILASAAIILDLIGLQIHLYISENFIYYGMSVFSNRTIANCGFGIAAAWLSLALAGCWRPEPGWIDRTGRLLGICWIALWGWSRIQLFDYMIISN